MDLPVGIEAGFGRITSPIGQAMSAAEPPVDMDGYDYCMLNSESGANGSRPSIQAVCFDLDGLMFNTEDVFYLSADVLLQRRGLRMTRGAMDAMLGRRPLESFRAFCDYLKLNE